MRRLLWITLGLFVLIACLLGAIVLPRHAPTDSTTPILTASGFALCAGKPCFKQIVPGETRWESIDALLAESGTTAISTTDRRRSRLGMFEIYQSPPDYLPDRVGLVIVQVNVPLHEVVQLFGKPCSVRLVTRNWETFSRFRLLYPFVEVYGNPHDGEIRNYTELDPMLRVDTILIRAKTSKFESDRGSCIPTTDDWFELFGQWHGFAPLQTYRLYAGH